jgi:hypothetical protein
MGDAISGILPGGVSNQINSAIKQSQQNQSGRSFEDVLRGNGNNPANPAPVPGQEPRISGTELERMRVGLTENYGKMQPNTTRLDDIFRKFTDTQTTRGLLRVAMNSVSRQDAKGIDLHGRFAQVENEWAQIESIMKSSKSLSTGELLGLQARLYQVSQHVEVMSKVVDQVTGGIKTILNTNV